MELGGKRTLKIGEGMKYPKKTKRRETNRKARSESKTPNNNNNENEELGIGRQVEVRSEEEGFGGVWFLARVVEETEDKKKILVEYRNLLSEEKGASLLKEYVDLKYVRPLPPVDPHHPVNFEANDLVDAYYQDGWWSGVVTQVVEPKSKYKVFFPNPNPPDEILFSYSDLRLHRAWIHGLWLLPPQQRMRVLNFSPLTAVEVNFDPDTSRDIWFPATVVRQVSNHYFLVEYQSSRDAGFQKVGVDSFHIRPRPPSSNYKTFSLLEKVDAFCDCRWLSGIVTKILADGRYIVYFKCTKEEKGLSHGDLRLHMEWADGKWVNSSRDTSPKSKSEKQSVHSDGVNTDKNLFAHEDPMVVKENNGQVIKISAGILGPCEKDSQTAGSEMADHISLTHSNKRNKHIISYFDAISSRRSRGSNEEAVSDAALSPETCKSNATITAALDTSVDLDTSALDHQGKSSLKQTEDMNQLSDSTNTKGDYEMHPVARKRGRPRKPQVVVEEIIEITPARSDSVKSFGQVVIGLSNDGKFSDSRAASSRQLMKAKKAIVDEEKQLSASANPSESRAASSGQLLKVKKAIVDEGKQLGASADPENVETEPQKEGVATNLKRKRGRPPKVVFPLDNPKTNEAVAESVENKRQHVDVEGSTEEPAVEEPAAVVEPLAISSTSSPSDSRTDVNIVSEQFKRLRDLRRLSLGKSTGKRQVKKHKMISIEAAVEPANTRVSKGKKLKSIIQAEPPTQDASDNSSRRTVEHPDNGVFRDSAVLTVTSSNASDDDRPLSAWLEGAHSPPATDRSHFVENGEIRDGVEIPCGQSEDKVQGERDDTSSGNNDDAERRETPIQSSAIVPSENQELPFVKNSLIWGMIESMEVFKRIPQHPHFFPLYDCKEECREGLAIGSMVTFTSLAERIAQTRFDDPMNLFDGYLEALVDLEELGFNVTPVRELLHKLISIKNRHEQAQNTSKEVESQIMEREQEKSKIGNEIAKLEKKIMELKEKQAVAVSKKERKDAEIALLHLSVDAVKEFQGSAQDEFDSVTASLW